MEGFSIRGKETSTLCFIDGSKHTAMTIFNVECITEWNKKWWKHALYGFKCKYRVKAESEIESDYILFMKMQKYTKFLYI